jgi:DeoR family transcriptional regulator of aga operon
MIRNLIDNDRNPPEPCPIPGKTMKLDRVTAIRTHLYSKGFSSVVEIAGALGVSEPTVRRDLMELEAAGVITRSHGGARIAEGSGAEVAFEAREQINLAQKRAIGAAAFGLLRPETAVFLDAGTTVMQLARLLRLNPMPLRLFTNCLPVAQLLMPVPELTVTLLGGTLRAANAAMVGMLAEAALDRLWFDQLFLGAGAIAGQGEVSGVDDQEARLNGRMLQRAGQVVVLADADKFGARLTWGVGRLGPGMVVVSDAGLAAPWRQSVADWGCSLQVAA